MIETEAAVILLVTNIVTFIAYITQKQDASHSHEVIQLLEEKVKHYQDVQSTGIVVSRSSALVLAYREAKVGLA